MKRKHKVLFVLPTLMAGGAERVMSFVAQNLNKDLFETTLLVIGHKKQSSYSLENLNLEINDLKLRVLALETLVSKLDLNPGK